jgi:DNA repair protein RadC
MTGLYVQRRYLGIMDSDNETEIVGLPQDTAGHRARLRKRLIEGGPDALLDHELIEYLIGLSIKRGDTKPLAKKLIKEFGGIGGLLTADAEAIMRNGGVGETTASALKIVQACALRMLQAEVKEQPVFASWNALLDYLRLDMAHMTTERVRILHVNSRNMMIRDEVMAEGSIDQAVISVREVIRRAIDLGSAGIIIVHNHPSGDPTPSRADIALTRDIAEAGRRLGILVHDHVIIGINGHSSMRSSGLI